MKFLILRGYELLSVMLPFVVCLTLMSRQRKKRGLKSSKAYGALCFVFAVYIFSVFYFTGAGTLYDVLRLGFDIRQGQINWQLFVGGVNKTGYVLNVLLFVPLGFLLPLIWPKTDNFFVVAAWGLGFSLLIEASQLLNNRVTDVDDLMMNTLGAVVGYMLFKLFAFFAKQGAKPKEGSGLEPLVYICVMFAGRFLLFDQMWLAGLLCGF